MDQATEQVLITYQTLTHPTSFLGVAKSIGQNFNLRPEQVFDQHSLSPELLQYVAQQTIGRAYPQLFRLLEHIIIVADSLPSQIPIAISGTTIIYDPQRLAELVKGLFVASGGAHLADVMANIALAPKSDVRQAWLWRLTAPFGSTPFLRDVLPPDVLRAIQAEQQWLEANPDQAAALHAQMQREGQYLAFFSLSSVLMHEYMHYILNHVGYQGRGEALLRVYVHINDPLFERMAHTFLNLCADAEVNMYVDLYTAGIAGHIYENWQESIPGLKHFVLSQIEVTSGGKSAYFAGGKFNPRSSASINAPIVQHLFSPFGALTQYQWNAEKVLKIYSVDPQSTTYQSYAKGAVVEELVEALYPEFISRYRQMERSLTPASRRAIEHAAVVILKAVERAQNAASRHLAAMRAIIAALRELFDSVQRLYAPFRIVATDETRKAMDAFSKDMEQALSQRLKISAIAEVGIALAQLVHHLHETCDRVLQQPTLINRVAATMLEDEHTYLQTCHAYPLHRLASELSTSDPETILQRRDMLQQMIDEIRISCIDDRDPVVPVLQIASSVLQGTDSEDVTNRVSRALAAIQQFIDEQSQYRNFPTLSLEQIEAAQRYHHQHGNLNHPSCQPVIREAINFVHDLKAGLQEIDTNMLTKACALVYVKTTARAIREAVHALQRAATENPLPETDYRRAIQHLEQFSESVRHCLRQMTQGASVARDALNALLHAENVHEALATDRQNLFDKEDNIEAQVSFRIQTVSRTIHRILTALSESITPEEAQALHDLFVNTMDDSSAVSQPVASQPHHTQSTTLAM